MVIKQQTIKTTNCAIPASESNIFSSISGVKDTFTPGIYQEGCDILSGGIPEQFLNKKEISTTIENDSLKVNEEKTKSCNRYKIYSKDLRCLKNKISDDRLKSLISIKDVVFTKEELQNKLNQLCFNEGEREIVEKYAKDPGIFKTIMDFLGGQADVLFGFKVMGKALAASAMASGIASVGLGVIGAIDIKDGCKEKDNIKVIKGVAGLMGSGAALGDCGVNLINGFELKGPGVRRISGVADKLATGLGLAGGVIDLILGGREVIQGIKEKDQNKKVNGALDMGRGTASILASLNIGGPLTAAALIGFFTAKVSYSYREIFKETGTKLFDKIRK